MVDGTSFPSCLWHFPSSDPGQPTSSPSSYLSSSVKLLVGKAGLENILPFDSDVPRGKSWAPQQDYNKENIFQKKFPCFAYHPKSGSLGSFTQSTHKLGGRGLLLAIPALAEWRKIEVIPEADEADSLKATRYGTRLGRLSLWIRFCSASMRT